MQPHTRLVTHEIGCIFIGRLRLFERHGPVLGAAETKTYQGSGWTTEECVSYLYVQ